MSIRPNTSSLTEIKLRIARCFLVCFLFLPFCAQGQLCNPAPSGLVGWWRAESNANDSADGNQGTLQGGVNFVLGEVGQAFNFNGTNAYVEIPSSASLKMTGPFSVEAWVNYEKVTAPYGDMIVTKGQDVEAPVDWALSVSDLQKLRPHVKVGTSWVVFDCATTLSTGVWYHVAMVYDGSTLRGFVNGVSDGAVPVSGQLQATDFPLKIGAYAPVNGTASKNWFAGRIDEVSIYNRALATNEIQGIYNAGSAGKCPPPTCVAPPSGLVSWWQAESNALDNADGNDGMLQNGATFAAGKVGQAFSFDGVDDVVIVPDAPNLRFGPTSPMTVDMWAFRTSTNAAQHLIGKRSGCTSSSTEGTFQLVFDGAGAGLAFGPPGGSCACSGQSLPLNTWTHLAGTFDGTTLRLFINGQLAATTPGSLGPANTAPLKIADSGTCGADYGAAFGGLIDEVSIYNRALSTNEVQAIYNAGVAGKCSVPPSINSQPASQTAPVGANVTFAVVAAGSSPLSYVWRFNQTNILVTATNSSFTLTNVQLADAGNYSVVVSNALDTVTSSNAILTVILPICINAQSNLVSWWQGDGNALDSSSTNHGTLVGNAGYATGRVGQGFVFDGSTDGVNIGNPTNLRLQNFTIEAWIKRANASRATIDPANINGCILSYGQNGYGFTLLDDGRLDITQVGVGGVFSSALRITDTNFHHVALTKSNSAIMFYVDGVGETASPYNPNFTFTSSLAIGARGDNLTAGFFGLIDDLAIYNRALSTNEIQSIYYAGSAGKCGLPPTILTPPQSRTVRAGTNVTFNVVATGTPLLSYQWWFNTTNSISGATISSLVVSNVQTAQAGNYTVVVSNNINSVTSAPANLKVQYIFAFGNGQSLTNAQYSFVGSVTIQLQTIFTNGAILYTLDGSAPDFDSAEYFGTFLVTDSSVLRVLTYSADFSQSSEADPITLTIIPTYSLTATTAGGGTVSVNPTNGPYASNSVVNVTATPTNGWTFLGWTGDASGTNTTIGVTMNRNRFVQALFGTRLSTTVAGNGAITFLASVFPLGALYPFGTVVHLDAVAQSGSYFALWGNAASGNTNPLSFAMTKANPTISALFTTLNAGEFALTVIPNGFGQVTVNPRANRYTNGQNVTLTAVPDAGRQFIDWSGDATGTNNPLIVVMDQSKTIMADFTGRPGLIIENGPDALNEEGFHLTLTGDVGGHYRIDVSTNLLNWSALLTLTNNTGTVPFIDPSATNSSLHLYRAVTVP
ncbi:MAG: immunoglobulin domain-containing protein [Verrucomicrobia bacterium]|nr:immunoglobulin domain-containing protein [Verrucomicrobiota bacterium]